MPSNKLQNNEEEIGNRIMCWANKKIMCEEGPNEDPEILSQS